MLIVIGDLAVLLTSHTTNYPTIGDGSSALLARLRMQ